MPSIVRRPTLTSPFSRPDPPDIERSHFQVLLSLTAAEPIGDDELETELTKALNVLTTEAHGLVLGPVGGVDFRERTVELEFTVETISPTVLYAKMGEVLRILETVGFEYESSKEARLDRAELQPA